VWHASIAVRDAVSITMRPWGRCGLKARHLVREIVCDLLAGVGSGNTRRDRSDVVLHARRRMSERELAMLDPAWCAIPAVAIAGDGIPW